VTSDSDFVFQINQIRMRICHTITAGLVLGSQLILPRETVKHRILFKFERRCY